MDGTVVDLERANFLLNNPSGQFNFHQLIIDPLKCRSAVAMLTDPDAYLTDHYGERVAEPVPTRYRDHLIQATGRVILATIQTASMFGGSVERPNLWILADFMIHSFDDEAINRLYAEPTLVGIGSPEAPQIEEARVFLAYALTQERAIVLTMAAVVRGEMLEGTPLYAATLRHRFPAEAASGS